MESQNNRVVTYLSEKYKARLQDLCQDREEKEATIVREILMNFFDQRDWLKRKKSGQNKNTKQGTENTKQP